MKEKRFLLLVGLMLALAMSLSSSQFSSILSTDKIKYNLSETVIITIDDTNFSGYSLEIRNRDKNYNFFDLSSNIIKFEPKTQGNHILRLNKDNKLVGFSAFIVYDNRPINIVNNKDRQVAFRNYLKKDRKITLDVVNSTIKRFEFNNAEFSGDSVLRFDPDIDKRLNIDNKRAMKVFGIDPTQLNFDDAVVTVEATGTELWKCKDWDFNSQQCLGSWVKLKDITPGQNYSFLLSALDPGFAETNWWDSSWEKRIEINITEQADASLTEYQIYFTVNTSYLIEQGYMNPDCSDVRFVDEDNAEADFFIDVTPRYKCNTTETMFWVKIPELENLTTTSMYMYYNNSAATNSKSDKYATFTYSSSKKIYYAVGENVYSNNLAIVSYINGNEVSIEGVKSRTIDAGEVNSDFLSTDVSAGTGFNVTGPILGGAADSSGDGDALIPISWAGKEFVVRLTRTGLDYYVFSPFCDATVYIYQDTSGAGSWGGVDETLTVNKGDVEDTATAWSNVNTLYFNASCPVLIYMQSATAGNNYNTPLYPMTDDLWGIRTFEVGNYVGSNTVSMLGSDGTNSTVTRGETDNWEGTGGSNDGQGTAYHLISEYVSIGGMESADSDGNEEAYGLPEFELETEYYVYDDGQYATMAITRASTDCEWFNSANVSQETGTSSQTGAIDYPFPSKLFFGEADGNPVDDHFLEGSRFVCDEPFYMFFEDSDGAGGDGGDEQVVYGAKAARQYIYPEPLVVVGDVFQEEPELTINTKFNQTPRINELESILFLANCSNDAVNSYAVKDVYVALQINLSGSFEDVPASGDIYANTSSYFIGNLSGGEASQNYVFKITAVEDSIYGFRAFCNSTTEDTIYGPILNLTVFDVTSPEITNIRNESITDSTAIVLWDTDETANSTVYYGETTDMEFNTSSASFVITHSVPLTGLSADNLYSRMNRSTKTMRNVRNPANSRTPCNAATYPPGICATSTVKLLKSVRQVCKLIVEQIVSTSKNLYIGLLLMIFRSGSGTLFCIQVHPVVNFCSRTRRKTRQQHNTTNQARLLSEFLPCSHFRMQEYFLLQKALR